MLNKASVIIASRNEGAMLAKTVEWIKRAPTHVPYEMILVDDGSADDSFSAVDDGSVRIVRTPGLGIAPARNSGAREAAGEVLVFCDAHIDPAPYWLDGLVRVIEDYGAAAATPAFSELDHDNPHYGSFSLAAAARSAVVDTAGCGRTFLRLSRTVWMQKRDAPFETPVLPGGCFAITSRAFHGAGGYMEEFRGYGADEEELSLKLWLGGHTLYAAPQAAVAHQFRRTAPYHCDISVFLRNQMYTALCHYNNGRASRLLNEYGGFPAAKAAYDQVFTEENIRKIRLPKFAGRKYDDDWFFSRFHLDL